MSSTIGFLLGVVLMVPFVIGLYFVGRREGWDEGYHAGRMKGSQDAFEICQADLQKAKDILTKFRNALN